MFNGWGWMLTLTLEAKPVPKDGNTGSISACYRIRTVCMDFSQLCFKIPRKIHRAFTIQVSNCIKYI